MPHDPYEALYIHVPFCKARCNYCDFHTRAVRADSSEIETYAEYIVSEIRRLGKEGELSSIETVYIGGGTPTHAGTKFLTQVLYTLGLTMHLGDGVECTVEANPESVDERLIRDIWALGANRISIGVQSFDDEVLKTLGRPHSASAAVAAINNAASRFENISIDLMCGIPGQTFESFRKSLECAFSLPVKHISVYPLTIEEGTPFAKMMRRGRLELPSEDLQADMMELASRMAQDAGMHRYEVASYSFSGFESKHNISYWTAKPYLGIGESAVTMTQNETRRMRVQDGYVIDDLDPAQMAAEDLMLRMRMSSGIPQSIVDEKSRILPDLVDVLEDLRQKGLVVFEQNSWHPTDFGWLCGNEIYGALLDLAP